MVSLQVLLAILSLASDAVAAHSPFNPREYAKKVVSCPAINRAENAKVDIELHYVDINAKAEKTLLLLHGWPSLWASWKYQIQEFQDDYHIIAPDLRGFGPSTHPGDVKSSGTMPDLVGDLLCILEHAGSPKAIAMGHDWGAQLAYEAARERPDVFTAVVGITIPVNIFSPFAPGARFEAENNINNNNKIVHACSGTAGADGGSGDGSSASDVPALLR
jgi:soluble epoxide hydrolase/lipid-phosphate phosphatase